MKLLALTTIAISTVFSGMAFAQDALTCDDETFASVMAEVEAAPEATKDAAVAEFQMAKEKMLGEDPEACAVHLGNASKASASE